jgi:hypothetical protein
LVCASILLFLSLLYALLLFSDKHKPRDLIFVQRYRR